MTQPSAIPEWSMKRLIVLTLVIVSTQFLLLFWLSRKSSKLESPGTTGTGVQMPSASASTSYPAPDDPANYVLPSLRGFSGPAWLQFTPPQYTTPAWTEPSRELPAPVEKLGESVVGFVGKKPVVNLAGISEWEKEEHEIPVSSFASNMQSHLEIRDGLARWASNSIPDLKPQASSEILRNSIVLAGVDEDGNVFSAILLPYGKSGSPTADAEALAMSRAAKFYSPPGQSSKPEANSAADSLRWGRLVFHWATVPPADAAVTATNLP